MPTLNKFKNNAWENKDVCFLTLFCKFFSYKMILKVKGMYVGGKCFEKNQADSEVN